ncbi:MAG TPA: NAD-dependent epimerase/dehydratase family protein [Limnochordales bacterium]|nr:NAD-dependent epimerase/dehydratase family protein [Limnochordales bacterium]
MLVTGAAGFLGRHVVAGLRRAQRRVRGLVRPGTAQRLVAREAGDEVVAVDLLAPAAALGPALRGVTAVVHVAGLRAERPWRGETFQAVHVEATARLVAAAREAGVQRFVLVSCLGAAADADLDYLRSKAAAEAIVQDSGLAWTILRCGLTYGPGDGRVTRLARWMAWLGRAPVVGDGRFLVQPIAVGDVVAGCVRAATTSELAGRVLAAAGPDTLSFGDMVDLLAAALDRRMPRLPIPVGLARGLAALRRVCGIVPWTVDELQVMLRGYTCDPWEYFRAAGIRRPLPFSAAVRTFLGA